MCQCWGRGLGQLWHLPCGGSEGFTWLIHLCIPHRCWDRGVATLGQSVQSPFSQEIKKYTTWVASRPGPEQRPAHGTSCLLCEGQQRLAGGIPAPPSPGSWGLETWGPWSSRGRGTDGALAGPAGGPSGLVLWHLGPMACCRARWEQPPRFLLERLRPGRQLMGVSKHCSPRGGWGALGGQSGVQGPAPTSPLPGSPSQRQQCPSSWFCAR